MIHCALCLCAIIFLALTGCTLSTGHENTPTSFPEISTPTPTPRVVYLAPGTAEPVPPPIEGKLELRIPFDLDVSTVIADPGEGNECLAEIPFQISQEGDRKMAHGNGLVDCHWIIPSDPIPYTMHVFNQNDASFDGEILPPSESYPEGWIDGYLNVNGTHTQYYVDVPPYVPNLCPESDPCSVPGSVVFILPFPWVDGSVIEEKWIFILHIN